MRYDFQLLFFIVLIGLLTKRLDWRGWFGVGLLVVAWMAFNMLKG